MDKQYGLLVWGKLAGFRRWPAMTLRGSDCGQLEVQDSATVWVYWFADHKVSKVSQKSLLNFGEHFEECYGKSGNASFTSAVSEAIEEWCARTNLSSQCPASHSLMVKFFLANLGDHSSALASGSLAYSPALTRHLSHLQSINKKALLSTGKKESDIRNEKPLLSSGKKEPNIRNETGKREPMINKTSKGPGRRWKVRRRSVSSVSEAEESEEHFYSGKKIKRDPVVLKSSLRDYTKSFSFTNNNEEVSKPSKVVRATDEVSDDQIGRHVWAKLAGFRYWPGVIVSWEDCCLPRPKDGYVWVFWFGDHYVSQVKTKGVSDFLLHFTTYYSNGGLKLYKRAVTEAIRDLCCISGEKDLVGSSCEELLKWASRKTSAKELEDFTVLGVYGSVYSPFVLRFVRRFHSYRSNDSGSSAADSEEDIWSQADTSDDEPIEGVQWLQKMEQMSAVRNGSLKIEAVCISCSSVSCRVVDQHPLFVGGVCAPCKEAVVAALMDLKNPGLYSGCVLCAVPGRLLLCDNVNCSMLYCTECTELMVGKSFKEAITESASEWLCFLCAPYTAHTHGLLKPRKEWKKKLKAIEKDSSPLSLPPTDPPSPHHYPKRPLRVLSLFDGVSTGLYSLDQAGLPVSRYLSSEVCPDALLVSQARFGARVERLGDVRDIDGAKISEVCPIDLLIGGSPCNDLSGVNPNRRGLYDPEGTGILFFDFLRILKLIKKCNGDRHLFWLFENVASMSEDCKNSISKYFHSDPVVLDARNFTAMSRTRYFWGNIPGLADGVPSSDPPFLQDFIEKVSDRRALVPSLGCITTSPNSVLGGLSGKNYFPVHFLGKGDRLWITEIEKLFGFPRHFTDIGGLNYKKRLGLLGKAWCAQLVTHILGNLRPFFAASGGQEPTLYL